MAQRMTRFIGATVTACFVVAAAAANAPAQALGSSRIGSNTGAANIRVGPSTDSRAIFRLQNGYFVQMACWRDAQTVRPPASDYASARWFVVRFQTAGINQYHSGWVHSSLVESQTSVGKCSNSILVG